MSNIKIRERADEMEVREQVAQLLERYGWIQGQFRSDDGYDVEGALLKVGATLPLELFDRTVVHFEKEVGQDLTLWNDTQGRTRDEVLAALRGTSS